MASKKTSVGRRGFLKEASAGAVALAGLVPAAMGQQTQLAQGRTGAAAPANTTGSYATTQDRVRLYYEETGTGKPVVFVHEFAGDLRSWEPQMRHFGRRYRCIAFNARGYPPSDVPESLTAYSQTHAADDIKTVLDHLAIDRAHIVGLSMGGFATLHFGFRYPNQALSLCVAGCGYGAEPAQRARFREEAATIAEFIKSAKIAAFPDGRINIKQVYAAGNTVTTEFVGEGTHTGDFMGVPPSGRKVSIPICDVLEIRDGKIHSEHEYIDMLSMMQQVGAIQRHRMLQDLAHLAHLGGQQGVGYHDSSGDRRRHRAAWPAGSGRRNRPGARRRCR